MFFSLETFSIAKQLCFWFGAMAGFLIQDFKKYFVS